MDPKSLSPTHEAPDRLNGVDHISSCSPDLRKGCGELMRPVYDKLDGHHQNH